MKRPILIVLIGYIIGIIWGVYTNVCIAPFIIVLIIVVSKVVKLKKYIYKYVKIMIKKETIIIFILSCIVSNINVIYLNNKYSKLYSNIKGENTVVCTIVGDKKTYKYKIGYKVKVEEINKDRQYKNTYLFLYCYNEYDKLNLNYGDKIELKCEYIKPEIQRNFKGFNYSEYLKTKKCYGIIKIKNSKIKKIKESNLNFVMMLANKTANTFYNKSNNILPAKTSNLLIAILIGKDDEIEEKIINNFRDSSLAHMLAVSGSHISYIIVSSMFIIKKLKLDRRKSKYIIIIVLIFFMFLTGLSEPVVRACIMGIIIISAELFYRKIDFVNSISLSLLILLMDNPFAIKNVGLLLSFGGVIGIVLYEKYFFDKFNKCIMKKSKLKDAILHMLAVTFAAQLMITPIILIYFNTVSLTFFISNLLAGYLLEIITIFGFFVLFISMISISLAKFLGIFLNLILYVLIFIADMCADIPLSKIYMIMPNNIYIIFYYVLISLVIYIDFLLKKEFLRSYEKKIIRLKNRIINWIKKCIKYVFLIIFVMIITFNLLKYIPGDLKIHFIDVSQGDSTLVITPKNKRILIDGGGTREEDVFNIGEKILVPYLLNRRIKRIDYMIISHFDSDHVRAACFTL